MRCLSHLWDTPDAARRVARLCLGLCFAVALGAEAEAQATYTASRAGDLQVGAGITLGHSNYLTPALGSTFTPPLNGSGESLRGLAVYSTFDFRPHLGLELNFRQASPAYGARVYERTYEAGGRFVYPAGKWRPYAKAIYGRGVFNYPDDIANLAYNLYSLGAGLDYGITASLNLRADYEHQHWFGFPLQPLQPNLVTIGVAYHFSGSGRCLRCATR